MHNPVRRRLVAAGVASAGASVLGPAWASQPDALMRAPRRALVVGNSRYARAPLRNPVNDARALGAELQAIGFQATTLLDVDRAGLLDAVRSYAGELERAKAVGLFYFAGHGVQLAWRNYLVPVDAAIERVEDVQSRCVDLGALLEGVARAKNPMNIVILDACRDNPFGGELRLQQKGLSQFDAPHGTFLAYATAPGHVASDGAGDNGLYTEHLLREIDVPQARIEDVFKRVRLGVRRKSNGAQVPWESTSLEEDFYFVRPPALQKLVEEQEARAARLRAELEAWERIRESRDPDDFYAFLQQYPSGPASEQAQFRLDQLQKPQVVAEPGASGVRPLASGTNRYEVGDEYVYDVVDRFSGRSRRFAVHVQYADNDRVVMSDGSIRDQMGAVIRNEFGTHRPGVVAAPADLAVGKRWRTEYETTTPKGAKERNFIDFRVVALEDVEVPAGRFKAFRVEGRGEAHGERYMTSLKLTIWIDAPTMIGVRVDREYRSGASLSTYNSVQLVRYTLAPR